MMKSPEASKQSLRGIAALFDDGERKEVFRKYLFFLGWIEVFIFAGCFLYQLGDQGYDKYGPITTPFPWKVFFLLSFLTPVAITFLLGVIIIGFNKYFGEPEAATPPPQEDALPEDKSSRAYKFFLMVSWLQRLPYLSLLLLLGLGIGIFYKLDTILYVIGAVGEKSAKIVLWAGGILLVVAAVFAIVMIVLNFKLRKKSMEYKYKTDVAERFGLIILDDNTVLNSEGRPLVHGKNFKDVVPLLPGSSESQPTADPSPKITTQTADLKST